MGGGGSRRNADNALGPANGGGVKTRNSSPYPPGEGTGGCNTGQFASRCCTWGSEGTRKPEVSVRRRLRGLREVEGRGRNSASVRGERD